MEADHQLQALALTLRQLLLSSMGLQPDDLGAEIADATRHLGAEDVVVLLCDYDQQALVPFDVGASPDYAIDASTPGLAFRNDRIVAELLDDGRRRLWIPVRDSSEREGILGVVDDGSIADENWLAVASLVGELVTSKEAYGDYITRRKRQRPFSISAEMRWALLPPLTYTCPDVTICGFVEPADRIAGDAFDYAVTGRTASVAVLDAMGHGLEAARMANLAIGIYRNSRRNDLDLVTALKTLDEVVAIQFGDSRFVTAQIATLDLDSGRMDVANAGHPRPLLLRRGGPAEEVPCAPAAPAGVECEPTLTSIELSPGDTVLFRTDGVTEARSPSGHEFSEARLVELVARLIDEGLPPSEVLRQTVRAVVDHRNGRSDDDATLVMLGWKIPEDAPTAG